MAAPKPTPKSRVWIDRMAVLSRLGYPDYPAYLESPRWQRIRGEVLARDNRQCRCGKEATQVHHRRYDEATLLGDTLDHMVAVCGGCHLFGSIDRGRYTDPEETDKRIEALVSLRGTGHLGRKLDEIQRCAVGAIPAPPAVKHCPTCRCGKPKGPKMRTRRQRRAAARREAEKARLGAKTATRKPDGTWDVSGGASRRR